MPTLEELLKDRYAPNIDKITIKALIPYLHNFGIIRDDYFDIIGKSNALNELFENYGRYIVVWYELYQSAKNADDESMNVYITPPFNWTKLDSYFVSFKEAKK